MRMPSPRALRRGNPFGGFGTALLLLSLTSSNTFLSGQAEAQSLPPASAIQMQPRIHIKRMKKAKHPHLAAVRAAKQTATILQAATGVITAVGKQSDFQPVDHAKAALAEACLPEVAELSRLTVDAPHSAISTWDKSDANDRMFESVVGMKYDNAVAPRGVAIIMASPNPVHKCDGSTVQVQPSSLSCAVIQKNLAEGGADYAATDLNGMAMIQSNSSLRILLLPTVDNGCTIVGVGVYFDN
jgi:hypothetical protein